MGRRGSRGSTECERVHIAPDVTTGEAETTQKAVARGPRVRASPPAEWKELWVTELDDGQSGDTPLDPDMDSALIVAKLMRDALTSASVNAWRATACRATPPAPTTRR